MANECIVFIGMRTEYFMIALNSQNTYCLMEKIPLANTDTQKMNNKANFR